MKAQFLFLNILLTGVLVFAQTPKIKLDPIKLAEDTRQINDPALIAAVDSNQVDQQIKAAVAIGRILKPEGVDLLLKLLKASPRVQVPAIYALGQYGWDTATSGSREKELVTALQSFLQGALTLKLLAIEAIGKLYQPENQNMIIPFLDDASPAVRDQALRSLYQLRNSAKVRGELATLLPIDTVTLSKITLLLNDSKTDIRISAAYLLDALKDKSALNALLKSTQDQDGMVRLFSIRAIGNLEKLDALDKNTLLPKLVGAVQDSSYLVRTEAWLTMTKLQIVPEVLQQIGSQFELLKQDKNAHVRSVIVDALASQATATPDLFDEFLKDSGALVRARAVVARSQLLKDHLIDFLQQTLQDSSWWVRSKTADVIDSLPAVVKETFIFEAIKDSAVQVRVNTILNLVNTTTPLVITLVENKLKSKDLSERYSALATIYSQQQPNMMTLLNDCYLNSQEKKFQDIRTDIISIFASVNTAETTSYLKTALSDINPRLAYSAYKELKNRAVPDLAPMNEPIPDLIPGSFSTFKRNPKLIINTSRGFFVIELYPQYAPFHVSRVVDVARRGEYDGLVWHRVENNFVIQGGDPEKTGWGVGKDIIRAEINPLRFKRGSLGMPRSTDWDSGGTQLFINHVPTPRLDGLYTLFGQVIQGMDVVDNIQPGDSIIKVTVQY